MWKNVVEPGRPQVTWRMRIACWIPKAEYAIIVAFPLQQWLQKRASMLGYMYIASVVWSCARIVVTPQKFDRRVFARHRLSVLIRLRNNNEHAGTVYSISICHMHLWMWEWFGKAVQFLPLICHCHLCRSGGYMWRASCTYKGVLNYINEKSAAMKLSKLSWDIIYNFFVYFW
jgi:hypothetical protein